MKQTNTDPHKLALKETNRQLQKHERAIKNQMNKQAKPCKLIVFLVQVYPEYGSKLSA